MAENTEKNPSDKKSTLSWSQPPVTVVTHAAQQSAASGQSKRSYNKLINGVWISSVSIVLIALIVSSINMLRTKPVPKENQNTLAGAHNTAVDGENAIANSPSRLAIKKTQPAGMTVAVAHIEVSSPIWVVVYENKNGGRGPVLGAALFDKGRTQGVVELLRPTLSGKGYFVGQTKDDGDRMYSAQHDTIENDAQGKQLLVPFTAQ